MSAEQKLITIDDISEENAPTIFVAGGLGRFIDAVRAEVCAEVPDLKTRKGRERIASLSATVSKRKASVEKPGRDYLRHIKTLPKVVEDELREFVSTMNTLRDEIRQPLTDWEAAEQARKDRHVDAVQFIHDFCLDLSDINAAALLETIASVEAIRMGDQWEEFEAEAARAKDSTLVALRAALIKREQYEAEQAELARLRAEKEAQAQRDREAEIARQSAEKANQEAERRAQAEREVAAKREQALIDQAAARQREAEQATRDAEAAAERQRRQLQLQAEQAQLAAEQAEANRAAAELRAEQERISAERRQAQAVEQAKQDEIRRQSAAKAEEERQARAREADIANKTAVLTAAKEAVMQAGITEEQAKAVVNLVRRGLIPNVSISF